MKSIRIEHEQIPPFLVQALAGRDAALWVGKDVEESAEAIESLRTLIGLPWKLVLCELSGRALLEALGSNHATSGSLTRKRGFIHLVASDPEGVLMPPRALPVFLLNGRLDPREPNESQALGIFGVMRRRLNMLKELTSARPRVVVLVSNGGEQPLEDFLVLWKQENFRTLVILLSTSERDAARIDTWLLEPGAAAAVDHWRLPLPEATRDLVEQLTIEIPETLLVVRIRDEAGSQIDLDITSCELVERPILEGYELIQSKDLRLMQPSDLTAEEFSGFFDRSVESWKPYAAGLPWRRNWETRKKLLDGLKFVAQSGPSENRILSIISESGAGGTTFARMLAYEAASEGYPTLVARPGLRNPQVLELSNFLYRAHTEAMAHNSQIPEPEIRLNRSHFETPWLIVFDVNHWEGRDAELRSFLTGLTQDGRPVVVMCVSTPFVPADLTRNSRVKQITSLSHELNLQEALLLGQHLNKFLTPLGKQRSEHEWTGFWEAHRPEYITTSIANFWIALEFWLKGQLDLNESIQSWLYKSFRDAEIADDLRVIVLEIAALSIERQPLPEGLMPLSPVHRRPYSWLLEDVRTHVPALALVREVSAGEKVWAMAHDLLGRYLITSTFFDHAMLERLGLQEATDPVQLRLLLLRRIACSSSFALKPFRSLALDFAIKILKLDASGNQEFVPYWREVLSILAAMPASVRETSRAFNHHIAVSLRRVAKQKEFGATAEERKELLERAIAHLEYALHDLDGGSQDESNLNLFNSLALAFQDLSDIELEAGATPERLETLRAKATEATRNAFLEDPTNSYTLETMAKNLIQTAEHTPQHAASSAAEALGFIYQAIALERSEFRQTELMRLANRALKLLRSSGGQKQIDQLTQAGNPLGTLAEAWLLLTEGVPDLSECDLERMPPRNVSNALSALESVPEKSNWMLLRFRYDLITTSRPNDFMAQLLLLDELAGTSYRMPLQIQLEYAILLHQLNRATEANRKFHLLRKDLKQFDAIVEVPERLYWLRSTPEGGRRTCDAQVVESRGQRSVAKVRELKDEVVPFIPQEFGVHAMRPGAAFKCSVTFGRMGPFLKPPQPSGGS
ncbi:MAG: hypothetical protein V4689_19640 [Verrucomicrobiota bacterium]